MAGRRAVPYFDHIHVTQSSLAPVFQAIYNMVGPSMKTSEEDSSPEKRVDTLFRKMDTDHDGKLSLDEFIEGAKSDPSIVRLLQCNAR